MNEQELRPETSSGGAPGAPPFRSLRELIDMVSGRNLALNAIQEESGIAEVLPYPFLALVGQSEMKLALVLNLINPAIGGVLLVGPRGTGKTTAVRSLIDLLPQVTRSTCFYGCMPEDVEAGGLDAICPDCARKYGEGKSLTYMDRVHLVELPLNSRIEDVVGGLDERSVVHERLRLKRGILSQADQNILFIDEVNLLSDEIVDAILDAAALGSYTVRRGPMSATYKARFTLIGAMNPEEGKLRPQIMDRFGLRIIVRGLSDPQERLEAYHRVVAYRSNPRQTIASYADEMEAVRVEVEAARRLIKNVQLPPQVAEAGVRLIQHLHIDSLRAEITLFEAARAYAAADSRSEVTMGDLHAIANMTLRLRRSQYMVQYFNQQMQEENELNSTLDSLIKKN